MNQSHKTNVRAFCKHCLTTLDAAKNADNKITPPKPGDKSICGYCGTIAEFDENLCLEPLTATELALMEMETPEELWEYAQKLSTMLKERYDEQSRDSS